MSIGEIGQVTYGVIEKPAPAATRLPQSAIRVLLTGRHAARGGSTRSARGRRLAFIASLYTREEFLAERGVGPVAAGRVESWLRAQGLRFREVAERGGGH